MKSNLSNAIVQHIQRIDETRVQRHVETLAGFGPRSVDDPSAVARTLDYLHSELASYGYHVSQEPFGDQMHEVNLLASVAGQQWPQAVIELGAHYDTVRGSPGADDNASAVAGVLEIARVLCDLVCHRSVRFCLFGAEESGLRGSHAHVDAIRRNTDEQVEGIVVFEMIGYRTSQPRSQRTPLRIPLILSPPRVGNFICAISNFRSRHLVTRFQRAARRFVPDLPLFAVKYFGGVVKDGARSDHRAYWHDGRRGIMITDTANFRNPHYHQPSDLPETLDYEFAAQVARATAAMLIEWAGSMNDQ